MSAGPAGETGLPIIFEGALIDLGHLATFILEMWTQGRPHGVKVRIRFSNHCYSERYDETQHADRPVVMDHKVKRAFCPVRYAHSRTLPELVRGLPESHVFLTPEANYVRIALSPGAEYRMYFNIRRSGGGAFDLDLYVESAYVADAKALPTSKMQKVRFTVLVDRVMSGKPLKFNHRR